MADIDLANLNVDGKEDDHALRYLAASLILHWDEIPEEVRARIYRLAISGKIIGLPQTVQLKQQIDSVIRRNTDA